MDEIALRVLLRAGADALHVPHTVAATATLLLRRTLRGLEAADGEPVSPARALVLAAAALFAAAKGAETPRRLGDVVNVVWRLSDAAAPLADDRARAAIRASIIAHEAAILNACAFQMTFLLPHRLVVEYARALCARGDVLAAAMAVLADVYTWGGEMAPDDTLAHGPTCHVIDAGPHELASAALFVAAELGASDTGEPFDRALVGAGHERRHWWAAFGVTDAALARTAAAMVSMYEQRASEAS